MRIKTLMEKQNIWNPKKTTVHVTNSLRSFKKQYWIMQWELSKQPLSVLEKGGDFWRDGELQLSYKEVWDIGLWQDIYLKLHVRRAVLLSKKQMSGILKRKKICHLQSKKEKWLTGLVISVTVKKSKISLKTVKLWVKDFRKEKVTC